MGFADGLFVKEGGGEGGREGIAGTDRVGHFNTGRFLEEHGAGGEDITAIDATGEHQHLEVVLAEDEPTFVFDVQTGVAEKTTESDQFFVVYLQNVAGFNRLLKGLLGVKVLAEVDVEDFQAVRGSGLEKATDGVKGMVSHATPSRMS